MSNRFEYFIRSARNTLSSARQVCPNCGAPAGEVVARKYFVTVLRRCGRCLLLYRAPTDDPAWNEHFYNARYAQGFTTDMPTEVDLDAMKAKGFSGTPKDYQKYIKILQAVGVEPGALLFDFGCSWGYGSWQLARAGYEVWASEISRSRRAYAAENLDIRVVEDIDSFARDKAKMFDCFFSAHVLEHVPSPNAVISLARKLLKPGGLFVAITPNGSMSYRDARPRSWMRLWGEVHPNFLDEAFYDSAFEKEPMLVFSRDGEQGVPTSDATQHFFEGQRVILRLDRPELVCIARLNDDPLPQVQS